MHIKLTIPGIIVAQQRPRFTSRGGSRRAYDPPKCKAYKKWIAQYADLEMEGRAPMQGPIGCELFFYYERKKTDRATDVWRAKAPDFDNLAKIICDGCNGIVYGDDRQIVSASIHKLFTNDEPRVEAQFWTMN